MISLYDLLRAATGQLFGEPGAQIFSDFCLDPNQAAESLMYVTRHTEQGDTHHYIEEAIRNGVSGVLCTRPPDCDTDGVTVIMVPDTVDALLQWAHFTLGKLGVKTIGVSGSSGKSTAVAAISAVLEMRHRVHISNADVPGRLSLALSLSSLSPEHEFAVFKLDTTHPGEMAQMVQTIQPEVAVITGIDCVHPAAFDSCEQYIAELTVLAEYLSPGALLALNYDDDNVLNLATAAHEQVQTRTAGIDRFGSDVLAFNINHGIGRTGFDIRYGNERYLGRWTPIAGKDHLYSMLLALLVGEHYHILMDDGLNALKELSPIPGRMVALDGLNRSIIVDDSYRANPASTLSALDWLEAVKLEHQRLIFVLGDMDDMGKNSQFGHRLVGARMAEIVDYVVTQGTEAAFAARAALDEGMPERNLHVSYSSSDTMAFLETLNLNENDVIFIKGGAATQMDQLVRKLLRYPDEDSNALVRQATPIYTPDSANRPLHSSWIEIDTAIAGQNLQSIKQHLPEDVTIMAVVKADAYGHGAVMIARTVLANGANYLAVASIAEALALRDAGIVAPILVMSYLPVDALRQAITQNITASIYDLQQAQLYDRSARYLKGTLKYHAKLDTGMGRLGILADDAVTVFRHLSAMTNLELEGIYTHFSAADNDPDYTATQLKSFKYTVRLLRAAGFKFRYIHAANSAGTLRSDDHYFNLVRPGIMLYGLSPDASLKLPDGVMPFMTWKSSVLQVKTFPPDYPIGYGNTYRTQGEERIAILPVGYADGLRRNADDSPYRWREVLIHGQYAPIVGRISMEKMAVNVSHIPEVNIGDEVVLIGKQGSAEITATDIAGWLNTINYEVVTALSSRIPRMLKHS